MFVSFSVISIEIVKQSAKAKSEYLVMYQDATGLVYHSVDGVDPDWMIAKNRESLQPVVQLFLDEKGELSGKDLTRKQFANQFILKLEKAKYKLDALVSGNFLPSSYIPGAVATFSSRVDAIAKQVSELRNQGKSDKMISVSLGITSDDAIYEFVFDSKNKFLTGIENSVTQQTINVESKVILPTEVENLPQFDESIVSNLIDAEKFTDYVTTADNYLDELIEVNKRLKLNVRGKAKASTLMNALLKYHQGNVVTV